MRWFQTCRSLPMWKLSPRSRRVTWYRAEMDLLNPWKLTSHVWEKFRGRNECNIQSDHPQVVLQRSEIAPCFWVWNQTSQPAFAKRDFTDQHRSRGKVLATRDVWNRKGFHSICFLTHHFSWRSFKQCTFKNVGKSSVVRDVTVMVKCCLVLFTGFPSQTCLGCVRFQTKSESNKTSAFGLGVFSTPGNQRWCHFTGGLSGGACGSRKHVMLQPFPSCQPNTCDDRISNADIGVCLFDWISDSMGREVLDSWRDCCVRYRRLMMISYRIHFHAKCRLYWKNCLSECLLPKADKVEAEGCQDPRQLFFSLITWETCQLVIISCYLEHLRGAKWMVRGAH